MRYAISLTEQLIALLVFAACAAVCVHILVSSYVMTVDARDRQQALFIAENAAETYKASGGDFYRTALLLGGSVDGESNTITVFFDRDGCVGDFDKDQAVYILSIRAVYREDAPASLVYGELSVTGADGGELARLTPAARKVMI